MYELSITADIASAHFLKGYEGKCKNLHGHTWKIEVFIASDHLNAIGMVADFVVLKKQLKDFLSLIDHVHLNEMPYFKVTNPTTENIARYIYEHFSKDIKPLVISKVRVWESENTSVTYFEKNY